MPEFVLICRDKADSFDLRAKTRETHLAYIATAGDSVLLAGPMLDEEGRPIGSILIIKAEDAGAAKAFAKGDPYAKAGLFADVEARPFKVVTGAFVK